MSEVIRLTAREKSRLPDPDRQDALRFCPKCGREIPQERQVCAFCENTGAVSRRRQPFVKNLWIIVLIAFVLLFLFVFALFLTRNTGIKPAQPLPTPTFSVRGTVVPVELLP